MPIRQPATGVYSPVNHSGGSPVTVRPLSAATPSSSSQGAAGPPVNRSAARRVPAPATNAAGAWDEALESGLATVVHARADVVNRERNWKFQEHRLTVRLLRGKRAQQRDQRQLFMQEEETGLRECEMILQERAVALEQKKKNLTLKKVKLNWSS